MVVSNPEFMDEHIDGCHFKNPYLFHLGIAQKFAAFFNTLAHLNVFQVQV